MPCTRCAKQVSVFLENKPGRLTDVCRVLGDAGVNIRAFCVAEASEFGILRLIADKPGVAAETLAAKGYAVTEHEVLAVQLQDRPGDLARALTALSGAGINVEYIYAFLTPKEQQAVVIFRVTDAQVAETISRLEQAAFEVIPAERIYGL